MCEHEEERPVEFNNKIYLGLLTEDDAGSMRWCSPEDHGDADHVDGYVDRVRVVGRIERELQR